MSVGELWLILGAGLGLGTMVMTRNPTLRIGVAGLTIMVLLLHGIAEGWRYQLAPAYLLVAALGVWAAVGLLRPPGPARPTGLRRGAAAAAGGLGAVLLVVSAGLATALPVFALPAPTGPFPVGVRYVTAVDQQRREPFVVGAQQPRTLLVKLYYPASTSVAPAPVRYFHGSSTLLRAFAHFQGLPDFALDHLALVVTHATEQAPLSSARGSLPVILLSHGAGTSVEVQTTLGEDLASHGYLVAAIDHPYVSAATALQKRSVVL